MTDHLMKGLRPLTDLPYLRTTGFRTFFGCQYNWALNFLSPAHSGEKDSASSKIGTAAHAIIEDVLRSQWTDDEIDETQFHARWGKIPAAEQEALQLYLAEIVRLPVTKCLGIEYEFRLDLDGLGLPVKGTMDFIGEIDQDTILIVDHKTNRTLDTLEYWKADIQPLIYAMAARHLFPGKKVRYRLGYVNFPEVKPDAFEWDTDPSQDEVVKKKLYDAYSDMMVNEAKSEWPKKVNSGCQWCPIYKTCDEHKRANDNLLAVMNEKFSPTSTGERYEFVCNVVKVAEKVKAELADQLKQELEVTGTKIHGDIEYSVGYQNERSLPARQSLSSIVNWLTDDTVPLDEKATLGSSLDELVTMKVGGLDKLKKRLPKLYAELNRHVETKQSSPRIKQRPLKPTETMTITPKMKELDFG